MLKYEFRALIDHVVDGDTVEMFVDLAGFNAWVRVPFRLVGIAAREIHDLGGPEARDNLAGLLPVGLEVTVRSKVPNRPIPADKYAPRWDCLVIMPDGVDLATLLIANAWAVPWDGHGSQPKPPWPRPTG